MRHERNTLHNRIFFFVISVFLALIVAAFIFVFAGGKDSSFYLSRGIDLRPIFDGSSGDESFYKVNSEETFTLTIPAGANINRELCLECRNMSFEVYIDDMTVYTYDPDFLSIYGTSYGTAYHTIRIPQTTGDHNVRIVCRPTSTSTPGYILGARMMDGVDYMSYIYSENLANFVLSVFMTALGAMLFVCGLALMTSSNIGREIVAMGLFTVVAALWSSTEASYLQISTGNSSAVHFLSYICLMLMPGAASGFIGYFTDNEKSILIRIIPLASIVVCLTAIILTCVGIADYHTLLPATHILLGITIILGGYYTVSTIIKKRSSNSMLLLILAFAFGAIGGIIDIIRYYVGIAGTDTARFFRYGLLVFVLIMSIHEVGKLMSFKSYEAEADNMRNLARTDALTGLSNRMAFSEYMENLEERSFGHVLIVQLDVNYLKRVNDNYGHSMGDNHIEAAAKVINDSFAEFGTVYRSGGDEFIVTMEGENARVLYDAAIKKMNKCIDRYNAKKDPNVKLEIAYGMAEFDIGKGSAEDTLKKADDLMYKMKNQMKKR
ncbi:MAG: GGDEF domain-containing protein [Clostridiales bacterium]|nr:GGDEF domain-containing protein [Clostridiales bacterium]